MGDTMKKIDGLVAWLKTYEGIGDYARLNAIKAEAGDVAISTVQTDDIVTEYLDGSQYRYLTFGVTMVCDWSDGYDEVNREALQWGASFLDWLDAQNDLREFPNLGPACRVHRVRALGNVPAPASVMQADMLGRYLFQGRIEYVEDANIHAKVDKAAS